MKTPFDKIYVISLITNHERQNFIRQQFNELGLDFEFIYGTDFYNLTNDSKNNKITYPCTLDNFVDGRNFGCVISHYNAILYAYEFGYNNILIIEDDICCLKDKNIIEHYLNNIPIDAEFVTWDPRFLSINDNNEQETFLKLINEYNTDYVFLPNTYEYLCGGLMYGLMNRCTMELYLYNQRASLKMSDHVEGFFENPSVKRYVCNKCLCTDQYNISCNFNSMWQWYENIYNKISNLNINDFYIPNNFNMFSR